MESKEKSGAKNIEVITVDKLTPDQQKAVKSIQSIAFADVSDDEAEEDFYSPKDASVLAYADGKLVGFAGIHHADIEYKGRKVKLGGFGGVCVSRKMQDKGIGMMLNKKAMEYLKTRGDDIAFLSIDLKKGTAAFYEKIGFKMLPQNFSWTNSHGDLKEDNGGMIAPVNSQEVFEYILNEGDVLYVGHGYW